MIISCSALIRMRNVQDKISIENQNTHLTVNKVFFPKFAPFIDSSKVDKYDGVRQTSYGNTARIPFTCQ